MASWNDLIKVPTREQVLDRFLALLRLAGFPVASWHSGSFQKHTVETESTLFSDLSELIRNVAKGGLIRSAAEIGDEWVDLIASNFFDEARKPAVYTQGKWTLYDTGNIGPFVIQPGTFWVANADRTLRFVNVDPGPVTLPLGGSVALTMQAASAGTEWNVGVGALTEILTPQPGFAGSNEPLDTGTWITQQGADRETTESLVRRCLAKWATLGSGANDGAYYYVATSASPEITDARVYSPYGGAVRVTLRGSAGPVSAAALGLAVAAVEQRRPLGVPDVRTRNALVRRELVSGTIEPARNTDPAAALSAAQSAVDKLARETKIGARVSREKVIWALMNTGLEDIELATPAADFQLGDNEVWVPEYALTVV